jgi:hypothetical protein
MQYQESNVRIVRFDLLTESGNHNLESTILQTAL